MKYAPPLLLSFALSIAGCPSPDDSAGDTPTDTGIDTVTWELHHEIESLIYVRWDQPVPATARVEFRRADTEDWLETPVQELESGQAEFLLLGIPYDTEFVFRVVIDRGAGEHILEEQSGSTGPLPDNLPLPTVQISDPAQYEPSGAYLMSSVNLNIGGWVGGLFWKFIIDRDGNVVWAHQTSDYLWTTYMMPSRDGQDILWDQYTFWALWDNGDRSLVHRMKIDGTVTHTYETPGGHHAYAELPDQSIIWGAAVDWSTEIVRRVDLDGTSTTVWDCRDFHDELGVKEGCMSNTINYDEDSDSFLISFYTTNTVVDIDLSSGETIRWFGTHLDGYGFDPDTSAFAWQHGAHWLEPNRLLLSTHRTDVDEKELETVCREYVVDDDTQTLTNVWSFGEGEGLHAHTAGEAWRLDNGNTLHNYGSWGVIREVTPKGEIAWEVDWRSDVPDVLDRLIGRSHFISDLYAFAP